MAARSIREIIRSFPQAFEKDFTKLVETLLETQADPQKEVNIPYAIIFMMSPMRGRRNVRVSKMYDKGVGGNMSQSEAYL